ncbi:hypothetical protein Taro_056476, partial [Colocasia esculenta]|nr:hypothetical protein [Colocasia esculenta]
EDLVVSRVLVSLRVEGRPGGIQGVVIPLRVVKRRPAAAGCKVISSSQDSHGSTTVVTRTLPSDQVREVPPIRDPTIEAHQVKRAERDDDEDVDPRIQDD